jgi:hypothetical protein
MLERDRQKILLLFENGSSESVEQSTEFLAERAKDCESNGYESGAVGVSKDTRVGRNRQQQGE